MENPRILGITLARGGSKSIPNKNLVPLNSKPLIQYTFDIVSQLSSLQDILSLQIPLLFVIFLYLLV